jgi:phospholipid/cholesterol/gamma-HCH transport system permease protein
MTSAEATFEVSERADGTKVLAVAGDWTIWTIGSVEGRLGRLPLSAAVQLDARGLGRLDTSGAYLIDRALRSSTDDRSDPEGQMLNASAGARRLVSVVRRASPVFSASVPEKSGLQEMIARIGRGSVDIWHEFLGTLSFIGEAMATLVRLLARPQRIRWTSVTAVMEETGVDALPIISFLSFFIGLVIAFIGANLLAMFNASVFTVELVGIGMLREFGVVLTAILLAGRTDSAFTAQIGSMKMRQEIDAMRVMGLDPMEALVAPRLIALVIMTPLLAFAAALAGVAGGLMAAWLAMDISPSMFISRFRDVVPPQHFWTGIVKAPVFAIVVALVGCRQGLLVEADVNSLGRRTTSSVVQSIFIVIALDAVFAVVYYFMDV